jgi:hydrogenase nickel incorporation protein HypB
MSQVIDAKTNVLQANAEAAAANREAFHARRLVAINLMSAPGSGKTSVLETTITLLNGRYRLAVIEGDLQTSNDADRISVLGVPAFQINTGSGCHLDARMVQRAFAGLPPGGFEILFIENVGNLVCPAAFDLGEDLRVVVFSVTEGEDKPKKYPVLFNRADVVLINKIDLLPYLDLELDQFRQNVREVNPRAVLFPVSCRTHEGFGPWLEWLASTIDSSNHAIQP